MIVVVVVVVVVVCCCVFCLCILSVDVLWRNEG